jgi:hypothetical protein
MSKETDYDAQLVFASNRYPKAFFADYEALACLSWYSSGKQGFIALQNVILASIAVQARRRRRCSRS